MTYLNPLASVQSAGNSSSTPLSGAATFTGTGELNNYNDVLVMAYADVAGTLNMEFSADGTNWDSSLSYDVAASVPEVHRLVKGYRYFRVRYVNGSSAQSAFRLAVSYGAFGPLTSSHTLTAARDADTLLTRVGDYELDVAESRWAGVTAVRKFGYNGAVGTSEEDIWASGGTYTGWLTTAATVEAVSSDTDDTAAGSGARTITIVGLDENFDEATEVVSMNGTSATSATSTTFIRVFRAFVTTCGTYHTTNQGNITIRVSSGGATLAYLEAGRGQTQLAIYTVPAGKTAYMRNLRLNTEGNKQTTCRLYQYQNADDASAPVSGVRLILQVPGLDGAFDHQFTQYVSLPEKTDVWVAAATSAGTAGVGAAFELIVVDN